ncbi:hypothetical protein P7C73_g6427, partial [Tremellales sp. Uapishka_1]
MSSPGLQDPSLQASFQTVVRESSDRGLSPGQIPPPLAPTHGLSRSSSRNPPTSADIDAVIANAMANAPPAPPPLLEVGRDAGNRAITPLMTNLLPAAVGSDGRVNLFVGNLPYRVRWQDLKDLFRKAGTVLRADVSLGPDNRSRGYGTVLMGSREDGARAIDRFNGYTWQTRTLEVRPDRLPPEYEAQPHMGHHQPMPNFAHRPGQPPLFPFNPAPFAPQHFRSGSGFGNGPPPSSSGMLNVMSMPGMGYNPTPLGGVSMAMGASSPIGSNHSPSSVYGTLPPMPIGSHNFSSMGASPLAGSLSSGHPTSQHYNGFHAGRRDSLTPFSHSVSPDTTGISLPRSTSPIPGAANMPSRPPSSHGRHASSASPNKSEEAQVHPPGHGRAPPPGHLGPLPPNMFASVKAVVTPEKDHRASVSEHPHLTLEGLGKESMGLGAPGSIKERTVFVTNWQELKDLFRAAGIIIRADVATGQDRRPKGFGTVLFASEQDALLAVNMFHDRDIQGRRLHVERQPDHHHMHDAPFGGHTPQEGFPPPPLSNGGWPQQHPNGGSAFHLPESLNVSPIASRLPWNLNTSTPDRGNHHHPGPIAMPNSNPISPQSRLPPMTPSMPGFVFHAYPQTPPAYPQFLSPGLGPFSPGVPVSSPSLFGQYNPFLNPAPGAPVNRFPMPSGSAALGTPTTQAFPNVRTNAGAGAPGFNISQALNSGDYFPSVMANSSPLNAKERLASTEEDEVVRLSSLTKEIRLDNGTRGPDPPSPLKEKRSVSGMDLANFGKLHDQGESSFDKGHLAGRASLDFQRTMDGGLKVWSNGNNERRASWADAASGAGEGGK